MPDTAVTIYHNPRCSKSRNTLALLQQKGIDPNIVEYLKQPPDRTVLKNIVDKLGVSPEKIVRKGEDTFKRLYAGKTLSSDEWLDALAAHPILIERPIVIKGNRAVIGRPPENVLDLI
jgi:arsenate reductase